MKLPVKWISNLYRTALRHPQYRWVVIFGTLLYLVSPIDLSPDLLPLLGQIDDLALVMLLVTGLSEMLSQFWQGDRQQFNQTDSNHSPENQKTSAPTIDVEAVSID